MPSAVPEQLAARIILSRFDDFNKAFRAITRRAERRFEAREWAEGLRDGGERIDLYEKCLDEAAVSLRAALGATADEQATWAAARPRFASLVAQRYDIDRAETFFNSVTRKMLRTEGNNRDVEFFFLHPKTRRAQGDETVYRTYSSSGDTDRCHIGHARAAVVFDMIYRFLRFCGYDVTYVRNFTDVDDKIINRANREGVPCREISERYIREFEEDMQALGVERPTHEPRATENIPQIVAHIEKLIEQGAAYRVNGDVYFAVEKFAAYGKLSGRDLEEMRAGARVEVDERKRNPLDFALWKSAKPGEPAWESPWGPGRPGWHIECSAMSLRHLGEQIDIHLSGPEIKE